MTLPGTIWLCPRCFEEFWSAEGGTCPTVGCGQALVAFSRAPDASGVQIQEQWRYKPNRGTGTFTVVGVQDDRVTLRSNYFQRNKTIGIKTLRGDYERA